MSHPSQNLEDFFLYTPLSCKWAADYYYINLSFFPYSFACSNSSFTWNTFLYLDTKYYEMVKLKYDLYCSSSIHSAKVNQIALEIIWYKQQNIPNVAQCSWLSHRYLEISSTIVFFWKLKLNCFPTLSLSHLLLSTFTVFQFPVIPTILQELWIGTAEGSGIS